MCNKVFRNSDTLSLSKQLWLKMLLPCYLTKLQDFTLKQMRRPNAFCFATLGVEEVSFSRTVVMS